MGFSDAGLKIGPVRFLGIVDFEVISIGLLEVHLVTAGKCSRFCGFARVPINFSGFHPLCTAIAVARMEENGETKFPGFPYQPYSIQIDFMKALYQSLEKGGIAMLESPTGSHFLLPFFFSQIHLFL